MLDPSFELGSDAFVLELIPAQATDVTSLRSSAEPYLVVSDVAGHALVSTVGFTDLKARMVEWHHDPSLPYPIRFCIKPEPTGLVKIPLLHISLCEPPRGPNQLPTELGRTTLHLEGERERLALSSLLTSPYVALPVQTPLLLKDPELLLRKDGVTDWVKVGDLTLLIRRSLLGEALPPVQHVEPPEDLEGPNSILPPKGAMTAADASRLASNGIAACYRAEGEVARWAGIEPPPPPAADFPLLLVHHPCLDDTTNLVLPRSAPVGSRTGTNELPPSMTSPVMGYSARRGPSRKPTSFRPCGGAEEEQQHQAFSPSSSWPANKSGGGATANGTGLLPPIPTALRKSLSPLLSRQNGRSSSTSTSALRSHRLPPQFPGVVSYSQQQDALSWPRETEGDSPSA